MPLHESTTSGRLILDDRPAQGAWHMAADDSLLASAAAEGLPTLRFYAWSEPTLSLGYFQACEDRDAHAASRACPLVRRQTGGGAILHDHELTYSLTLPPSVARTRRGDAWYRIVHEALIRVLTRLGVGARLAGLDPLQQKGSEPFLCFERRSPADVLVDEWKVCGSAQRSRRGAILQHGSLLLAKSTQAPEIAGLREITGRLPSRELLAERWQVELEQTLGLKWEAASLSVGELQATDRLVSEKYASPAWNRRR